MFNPQDVVTAATAAQTLVQAACDALDCADPVTARAKTGDAFMLLEELINAANAAIPDGK